MNTKEDKAREYELNLAVNEREGGLYFPYQIRDAYLAGYATRDKELMEMAGQGFEEWFKSFSRKGYSEDIEQAWLAARLSMMAENEELKKKAQMNIHNSAFNGLLEENEQLKKDLEWATLIIGGFSGCHSEMDKAEEIRKRHCLEGEK